MLLSYSCSLSLQADTCLPNRGLTYRCIEEDGYDIDAKVDMLLSSDCASGIAKSMGDVQYWDERCFSASSA